MRWRVCEGALGDNRARPNFAGQRLRNGLTQARNARRIAEGAAFRVLHREYIERESVARRERFGVHDEPPDTATAPASCENNPG